MNVRNGQGRARGSRGFTLIEMMIVVLILSILAGVGYPSYIEFIVRGHRQAARSALYQLADRQEQFYLDNKRYAADLLELNLVADGEVNVGLDRDGQFVGADADDRTYILTIDVADDTSYTLVAIPQLAQADRDTDCGTLSLTSTGERDQDGGGDAEKCW